MDEILRHLRHRLSERWPGMDCPVYVVDGSSLQLDYHAELKKAYPPAPSPMASPTGPLCA